MIWALLAAYYFGGGAVSASHLTAASVKQMSEQVEMLIEDSERSEAAQRTLSELGKEVKSFQKIFSRSGRRLAKSYRSHATHRAEAERIFNDLNFEWEAAQQRALDLRFELKDSMTEKEWGELFPRHQAVEKKAK